MSISARPQQSTAARHRTPHGRDTRPLTAQQLLAETAGAMPPPYERPPEVDEFIKRQLVEANERWRNSLCRAAGLPEPFGSKFCERLAVTITDEPAEWGKLFSFAISQSMGVNHAS